VYPDVQTTKMSSPITGIQWNRTLQSTRSLSLTQPGRAEAGRIVRALDRHIQCLGIADDFHHRALARLLAFQGVALADSPHLFFLHYWANDNALRLAHGLRAALDKMNVKKTG